MEILVKEPKPVWETYPGYSLLVQLYHSFDMYMSDYDRLSEKDRKTAAWNIQLAHLLVLARMNENEYQELQRSMKGHIAQARIRLAEDWKYVCRIFDEESINEIQKHMPGIEK